MIKLNCDLGETDVLHPEGPEHQVMPYIHMANIACGFHAGNRSTILATLRLAKQHQVMVGAHPSYPDRENFGRLSMELSQADVSDTVFQQLSLMEALCEQEDIPLSYVKPHGALYHDLLYQESTRHGIFQAVADLSTPLPVLILAHVNQDAIEASAKRYGITLWYEAFADRRYHQDGRLQSRTENGAVLKDAQSIIAQAKAIAKGEPITTVEDTSLIIKAHSLCVHGDNPAAVTTVKAIRKALSQ